MQVILYNNTADEETLDKSAYISQVEPVTAEIKGACDIENPSMILNYNGIGFNYMYVPDWNRYYFISSITVTTGGRTYITAVSDPLMSYKEYIKNISCIVSATGNGKPDSVYDSNISLNARSTQIIKEFPSGGFGKPDLNNSACYLIAVKG